MCFLPKALTTGQQMVEHSQQIADLAERIARLNELQLAEVERFVARLEQAPNATRVLKESDDKSSHSKDWPHAPLHRLAGRGTFIVTAGTLNKQHFFRDAESLDRLETELLSMAREYEWQLEAWAVFSNHYHFVGHALNGAATLKPFLTHVHANTAREVNRRDDESGRQVWYNFWETKLTYEKSYLARLNYVHQNPVKHALVPVANQYRWCSAAWFERTATPAQVKTIYSFKTEKIRIVDDYEPHGVR
jgi:putative transposase